MHDQIRPSHYTHRSGVRCLDLVKCMSFIRGNCVKYIWRAGSKSDMLHDLKKAREYLVFLIEEAESAPRDDAFVQSVNRYATNESETRRATLVKDISLISDSTYLQDVSLPMLDGWIEEVSSSG